jgi:hypothetical protein
MLRALRGFAVAFDAGRFGTSMTAIQLVTFSGDRLQSRCLAYRRRQSVRVDARRARSGVKPH